MADSIADEMLRRFSRLRGDRGTWEHHWQQVAEIFQPRHAEFTTTRTQGEKRTEKVFDATPTLVPYRFAAALESLMVPRGGLWHGLKTPDPDLNQFGPVRKWLDDVRARMFRFRYHAMSGFTAATSESFISLGLYGTQTLYTEEGFGRAPITYQSIPLVQTYISCDDRGFVDTIFRYYDLTARQAAKKWGVRNLSENTRKLLDSPTSMDNRLKFLSVAIPREEVPGHGMPTMPIAALHFEHDRRHLVAEGGYFEMPFHTSRFVQATTEDYGRGPAIMVLPAGKMLNAMKRTNLRGAQKVVDPALAIASDDMPRPNLNAGAVNPGAVNDQGRLMIQPIQTGARPDIGEELMQVEREVINDAFWITLFQILVQNPQMTATEVLERSKEKAELVGPAIGKQETELVAPMVEREFGILMRRGLLPPPPRELEGVSLEVDYTSPMSRLRRASEGVGILRTLEVANALAANDPDVMDNIDSDDALRQVAEINGAPMSIMRDKRDVKQRRDQRQQRQAAQQVGENMALTAEAAGAAAPMVKALTDATQNA